MVKQVKKAIIPVAGLGTRFLPITKAVPKEMLPIVDQPMIQFIVDEAFQSGIEQVILINGHHKGNIEDYFDTNYELNDVLKKKKDSKYLKELHRISYTGFICSLRQKEAKGLGHAILSARKLFHNEPVAILLGDDLIFPEHDSKPVLGQLIQNFKKTGLSQVAIMPVLKTEIHQYGAASGKVHKNTKHIHIKSLVEKPPKGTAKTNLAIVGRYILTESIWPYLESEKPGKNGEIQLTDALLKLAKAKGLMGFCFEGTRVDAGTRIGFLEANIIQALKRPDLKKDVKKLLKRFSN